MAQFTSLYDLSRDALISYEFIEDNSINGLMRISNLSNNGSGSFTVKDSFIEDNTLSVCMRLSNNGILRIRGEYIEEDRTVIIPPSPPIPTPVGNITFDDFDSYTALISLNGLNSGSNEWDNTTPLAAYFAREAFVGIKATEYMGGYNVGDNINGLNLGSGSLGGVWGWDGSWVSRTNKFLYGIKVYEDFSTYGIGNNLNGLNGYPYEKWNNTWDNAWVSRTNKFLYGIKVYENFSTYSVGSNLNGLNGYPYEKWNNTWDDAWVVKLNVNGNI